MLSLDETTGNTNQEGVYRFEVRSGETETPTTLTTSNLSIEEGDDGTTHTNLSSGCTLAKRHNPHIEEGSEIEI